MIVYTLFSSLSSVTQCECQHYFFCALMLLLFVRTHVLVDRSKLLIQIQQSIHHHLVQSAGEPLRTNSAR